MRELIRGILDLHGYYGDPNVWLWRGQANAAHALKPGIHTRIEANKQVLGDSEVIGATQTLLRRARDARLNSHEGTDLPDLALLAMLQHHGAATPLLDVSLDPLVALYMAVVSPSKADDDEDGVLFAIKRPRDSQAIEMVRPFDTREFADVYQHLPGTAPILYSAPDVSERLRIQRGHFLLGRVTTADLRVSLPLSIETGRVTETWLTKRMDGRGSANMNVATTDIATFRIPKQFKIDLKDWLEKRTGLTTDFVYPTAWHQPHLEVFAKSHSRLARF
jgi:hypothetical protein